MASPEPSHPPVPSLDAAAFADAQASISAYYSLVFPNFTYFLQTLNVTIGRRCSPIGAEASSSSTEKTQVDVDLGPLKSVSRLHAKIEYEEEEERFVLVVVGRNGAWVDGVWSGSGSRVPLSERSQIQIASRTFHFVLPPPPVPEDSPSPSDDQHENARPRSPSVDILSHSPPSSLTSHSPPPPAPAPTTKPTTPPKPKSGSKKRKKSEMAPPPPKPPKPEVMPPKPQLTYSIMCYRAIKALGGKATLQDICGWMRDTFDWYKWNDEAGWENSVRHNLSSNRAFKKMERCAGERGKGFFWGIEEKFIPSFEEQEARLEHIHQQQANGSMSVPNGIKVTAGKSKKGAALSDPPLKRSVKAGSGPLPPPLTNTPLAMKSALIPSPGSLASPFPQLHLPPHPQPNQGTSNANAFTNTNVLSSPAPVQPESAPSTLTEAANTAAAAQSTSFISSLPPSVCIPIVIGSVPSTSSSGSSPPPVSSSSLPSTTTHLPTPPIVLHDNTLILNPSVFSHLTPEQLKELEALGAQKALEILQSYIVRFLKERIRGEKDGGRGGRGRGRGRPKRGGASGIGRGGTPAPTSGTGVNGTGPFTTTPLPHPNGVAPPPVRESESGSGMQGHVRTHTNGVVPSEIDSQPPVPVPPNAISPTPLKSIPIPSPVPPTGPGHTSESPIIIVDDVDADEHDGPALKKRRLDGQGGAIAV